MGRTKLYGIGVLLTFIGGAGLAEISTSSHGNFILCATLFSVGVAICLTEFIR